MEYENENEKRLDDKIMETVDKLIKQGEENADSPVPFETKGAQLGTRIRKLKIEVTPEIIAAAIPKDSGHCMISDAVKAAAAKAKLRIGKVLTDLQTIRFVDLDTGRKYICFTPRIGQIALLQFDKEIKPEPFHFKLKPVQIIEKQHRERKRTGDQPGKAPAKPRVVMQKRGTPVVIGGRALAMIATGQRREFGLRGMGVWSPPSENAIE
jgi:hypothetical protein